MTEKKYTDTDRKAFKEMEKLITDLLEVYENLPDHGTKVGSINNLAAIQRKMATHATPPEPSIIKVIKIISCANCPKKVTVATPGAGCASDWLCGAMENKKICGYIEWSSEEPKSVPEWCPLDNFREDVTPLRWTHDVDCGTKYRGCAPYCPKDLRESLEKYLADLEAHVVQPLTDDSGRPIPFHKETVVRDHQDILVENWLNSCFEAEAPIYRKTAKDPEAMKEFITAEELQDAYDNRLEWAVMYIEEIIKNL